MVLEEEVMDITQLDIDTDELIDWVFEADEDTELEMAQNEIEAIMITRHLCMQQFILLQ